MARKFEKRLSPVEERKFIAAYRRLVESRRRAGQKLNPDPDDPRHFYDHRKAWKSGMLGSATEHGSSKFKRTGHPRMILSGVNTKTGKMATDKEMLENRRARMSVDADIARAKAKR